MSESAFDGQPYLFISYATADRERVLPIIAALQSVGVAVWRDENDIMGGTSYGPAIASAIRGSAVVLILCSEASLTSRNVRQEMAIAWKHERPCLPLLLDPVTTLPEAVEYWLEGAQWIEILDHRQEEWLPKVTQALDRIAGVAATPMPAPAAASPRSFHRFNIPTPLTPILGRDVDIEAIQQLLTQQRLVTVLGPGGTGKTRLALAVAAACRDDFDHGVVFVDLSPVTDPSLIVPTIAASLDIRDAGGRLLLDVVVTALEAVHLLLVIDNWEQVVDAAFHLMPLLTRCPRLHILATSRIALRLRGEREYPLDPLDVPDAADAGNLDRLGTNAAVALFIDRAQAVRPRFDLTTENAEAVAAICQRLDGLPLAIELAASRVKVLPPSALLARLEQPLAVLGGGSRDLPERHQTIRATIQWSYDLLEEPEQRLLRALSVFRGGWTLEAAEAVTNPIGDLGVDVLDCLTSLVEKSMVIQRDTDAGDVRFDMLGTIREFAAEQLAQHGETETMRRRHAHTMRDLAHRAERYLRVYNDDWLDRIERDHDNIRAALTWAMEQGDHACGSGICGDLARFWFARGNLQEGYRWAADFLHRDEQPTRERAKAALCWGWLALTVGDADTLADAASIVLAISQHCPDPEVIAEALMYVAIAAMYRNRPDEEVQVAFRDALQMIEENHFNWLYWQCLHNYALHEMRLGRTDHAVTLFTTEDAIGEREGWGAIRSWAQVNLGALAHQRGDYRAALHHGRQSVWFSRSGRNRLAAVAAIGRVASHLHALGQIAIAVRLAAFVDRDHRLTSVTITSLVPDEVLDDARRHLGVERFESEWQVGSHLSLQEAIALALEVTDG